MQALRCRRLPNKACAWLRPVRAAWCLVRFITPTSAYARRSCSSPANMSALTDEQVDDILYAARSGDLDTLKETLAKVEGGEDAALHLALRCTNESGNSALHFAFANGHEGTLHRFDVRLDPLCAA